MAKVEWTPLALEKWNEKLVRNAVPGLRGATRREAEKIVQRARPVLAAHHAHNMATRYKNLDDDEKGKLLHSSLEVSQGTVDAFAALNDAGGAAGAIELYLGILKGGLRG